MSELNGPVAVTKSNPEKRLLLLAFLTLTARFHPLFVEEHGKDTAQFYAGAAYRLMKECDFLARPDPMTFQAMLMLGYHEHTAGHTTKSWVMVSTAIRSGQILGWYSHYDCKSPQANERGRIQEESWHRTLWTSWLLDQVLNCGTVRPMLEVGMKLRLPCSEVEYSAGCAVRTKLFREAINSHEKTSIGYLLNSEGEDGELVWYSRAVAVFSEITTWAHVRESRYGNS